MDVERIIKKYAPEVRLHSKEKHFPASIDWLVQRVSLKYFLSGIGGRKLEIIPKGELSFENLTDRYLEGERSGATNNKTTQFYLGNFDSETKLGEPIVNNFCMASCCAHFRAAPHAIDAIDIQYWFFYPYNSMQKAGYGVHDGDWEHITVRVTSDGKTILGVYFSAHIGEGGWMSFDTTGNEAVGTDHPIVYSAYQSHASYPTAGRRGRGGLPDDLTDDRGPSWKCWEHTVNLGEKPTPLNGQLWLQFTGRWGGSWAVGDIIGDVIGKDLEQPSPHTPSFKSTWLDDGGGPLGLNLHLWGISSADRIWESTNDGAVWQEPNGKARLREMYLGKGVLWGVSSTDRIWKSTDDGRSWHEPDGKARLREMYLGKGVLWGVSSTDRIWKSTDDGRSWQEPNGKARLREMYLGKGILWGVSSADRIWKSTDDGRSWQEPDGKERLRQMYLGNDTLLGFSSDDRFFVSIDDGKSWHEPNGKARLRQIYL